MFSYSINNSSISQTQTIEQAPKAPILDSKVEYYKTLAKELLDKTHPYHANWKEEYTFF